jgi:GNAT superfamily N-acetyltransferase
MTAPAPVPTPERIRIRHATADDAATIVRMVRELAVYEKLADQVRITEADVRRDGFGEHARFECLLAEVDGGAVAFALSFHNYSTFEGRPGIYLEDLHVTEAARGLGIGRRLMGRLAALAIERGCRRLDLWALQWNPARDFYERLGFHRMEDWLPYRIDGDALRRLAEDRD